MGLLSATRYVHSVEQISPSSLVDAGIRCVLLDRDNTCVPRDARVAPTSVLAWIDSLKRAGITIWMVSNNAHKTQVAQSAQELRVEGYVAFACKPFPFAIKRALAAAGFTCSEACIIGDQLFTDVLGGNASGVATILVRPQSSSDLWYTLIIRHLERALLSHISFEGE